MSDERPGESALDSASTATATWRVVHVTEALAGGVLSSLTALLNEQTRAGADVVLVHTRRQDTPPASELDALFANGVRRIEVPGSMLPTRLMALVVRTAPFRQQGWTVHIHSSWAGQAVRVALWGGRPRLLYSPHAFAFCRNDLPHLFRWLIVVAERLLAKTSAIIAVSQSEAEQARTRVRAPRIQVLENRIPIESLPVDTVPRSRRGLPVVVCAGRATPQKAPWRFQTVADQMVDSAKFVWVGAGHESPAMNGRSIEIVPWRPRAEALDLIVRSDVFFLPSMWEGLPVALIEAQCMGLPAVVSDIPGNHDVVVNGVTGFTCSTVEEMVTALTRLLRDCELSTRMGEAAQAMARKRFDASTLGPDSLDCYRRALGWRRN